MSESLRCAIVGYGRMGQAIDVELQAAGHEVVARIGSRQGPGELAGVGLDIAFDFTTPAAAPDVLRTLAELGVATVSGTTGWDVAPISAYYDDKQVPFIHAPNFALGVHLMLRMVDALGAASRRLPRFEAGILERHHSQKQDSPSGTAKEMARRFEARSGRPAPVVALRQGGIPGEHRLILEGPEESLELLHRARSRRVFAQGAVVAALWLLQSGRRGPVPFDVFLDALFEEDPR